MNYIIESSSPHSPVGLVFIQTQINPVPFYDVNNRKTSHYCVRPRNLVFGTKDTDSKRNKYQINVPSVFSNFYGYNFRQNCEFIGVSVDGSLNGHEVEKFPKECGQLAVAIKGAVSIECDTSNFDGASYGDIIVAELEESDKLSRTTKDYKYCKIKHYSPSEYKRRFLGGVGRGGSGGGIIGIRNRGGGRGGATRGTKSEIEILRDNLSQLTQNSKQQILLLTEQQNRLKIELKKEQDEKEILENEIKDFQTTLPQLINDNMQLKNMSRDDKIRFDNQTEQLKNDLDALRSRNTMLETKITDQKNSLANFRFAKIKVINQTNGLNMLFKRYEKLYETYMELAEENIETDLNLSESNQKNQRLEAELQLQEDTINYSIKAIAESNAIIKELEYEKNAEITKLNKQLTTIHEAQDRLEKRLQDESNKNLKLEQEANNMNAKYTNLKETLTYATQEKLDIEDKIKDIEKEKNVLKEKVTTTTEENEKKDKDLSSLEDTQKKLNGQIETLKEELNGRTKEKENLKKEMENLQSYRNERESLISKLETEKETLQANENKLNTEFSNMESLLNEASERERLLKQNLQKLEDRMEEREKTSSILDENIETFRIQNEINKVVNDATEQYVEKLQIEFKKATNNMLRKDMIASLSIYMYDFIKVFKTKLKDELEKNKRQGKENIFNVQDYIKTSVASFREFISIRKTLKNNGKNVQKAFAIDSDNGNKLSVSKLLYDDNGNPRFTRKGKNEIQWSEDFVELAKTASRIPGQTAARFTRSKEDKQRFVIGILLEYQEDNIRVLLK